MVSSSISLRYTDSSAKNFLLDLSQDSYMLNDVLFSEIRCNLFKIK